MHAATPTPDQTRDLTAGIYRLVTEIRNALAGISGGAASGSARATLPGFPADDWTPPESPAGVPGGKIRRVWIFDFDDAATATPKKCRCMK